MYRNNSHRVTYCLTKRVELKEEILQSLILEPLAPKKKKKGTLFTR